MTTSVGIMVGSFRTTVLVWLHGGGFSGGSGNWLLYDGTNLARKEDVVVVGVNHRLNLFARPPVTLKMSMR